ncbi:hypothetical protein BDR07DRAFT_1276424, partial [Suillus spraguei]
LAGKDAAQVFFRLHRYEVLQHPQYVRLQIGAVHGQTKTIKPLGPLELSLVPHAKPTWCQRHPKLDLRILAEFQKEEIK